MIIITMLVFKCKVHFTVGWIYEGVRFMRNKLEDLRKQHNLTQEDLADKLEVSRQTINSLEKGRYNPSILLAFKIARLFGLSIEDIFIYEEDV